MREDFIRRFPGFTRNLCKKNHFGPSKFSSGEFLKKFVAVLYYNQDFGYSNIIFQYGNGDYVLECLIEFDCVCLHTRGRKYWGLVLIRFLWPLKPLQSRCLVLERLSISGIFHSVFHERESLGISSWNYGSRHAVFRNKKSSSHGERIERRCEKCN